jgi:hypothetical protein
MEDMFPGTIAATEKQRGLMYGDFGRACLDLLDDLERPGSQAVIIVIVAAAASRWCFSMARPAKDSDA